MNELTLWIQPLFLASLPVLAIMHHKGAFRRSLVLSLVASMLLVFLGVASIKYAYPMLSGDLVKWLTAAATLIGSVAILMAGQIAPKKQQ